MTAISEAAMDAALVRELCSGRQFVEERMRLREHVAAAEASAMKDANRTIRGLGKVAAVIPAREFFTIANKYGDECWRDRGFVRDFQRLEPELAAARV